MSPRLAVVVGCAAALCVLAAGCGSSGGSGSSSKLEVVATTTQLGDFARNVGGGDVHVTQILRPNTDPHDYEPRPDDIAKTRDARLVLLSGDNLDKWMGKVVANSGSDASKVDVGAVATDRLPGETSGPEASKYDPHWWHDPINAIAAVTAIRDAMVKAEPSSRAVFTRNAAAYVAKLRALDSSLQTCIGAVPADRRKLVTDHDAFNYFAKRYDISVVGAVIPSQTTQAQPSAGGVARLVATIRREHVSAVFPESSVNQRLARAIARQTGASATGVLYGDTLGPAGSPGATYLGMERANADAMVKGFTGGRRGCA